ncbi:hypothetical protein BRADI_3g50163v3 [Brachypodium distachyon]|uniref:Uncharacterized protein n=1 Tax=Brachypodium distachyon TaxID=15368 RepID=A0A0Q3I3V6_BRADI|nr:hypothetical protein BRADI_3g50163v3 [Brachypodium distachyon]
MSRVLARHRLEFGSCVPLRPKTRVRSPRRPFFPEFLLSACASLPIAQPAPSPDSASLHPEQRRHGRRRRSPPCHPPFRWPSLPVTSPLSTAYQRRPDPAAGIERWFGKRKSHANLPTRSCEESRDTFEKKYRAAWRVNKERILHFAIRCFASRKRH